MNRYVMHTAAMLCFAAGAVALQAQAVPPASDRTTQAPTAQQANDMPNQEAKAFSGTIVKEKGKLVLKDAETKVSYQLDDQEKAKQFEGKQVKVVGKLDAEGKLIHIENIEGAS